ncbi:MAG: sensor histidine kinase [Lachnospiraceae bacterium]|nr:sensor histidine kinase [Lachnospiraceae bacterium]
MKTGLSGRIRLSYLLLILPYIITLVYFLVHNHNVNLRYETMLGSIEAAGSFNTDFKKDFDLETYLLIAGNVKPEDTILPQLLTEAQSVIDRLVELTEDHDNAKRLRDCAKYLNNLKIYIERIEENLNYEDKYDSNIMIWENDVQIITSLIENTVNTYIYEENRLLMAEQEENKRANDLFLKISVVLVIVVVVMAIVVSWVAPVAIARPIEEQVRAEQERLRRAEFELLQAQINPHFLYNTLDAIVWSAESKDEEQVIRMTRSLSDFFRASLSKGRDEISLRDELVHVRSYLEIQQIRYQDILTYAIDIDERYMDCRIPKITLQPLVENALYHGIKNKRGGGSIRLYAQDDAGEENGFVICVEDNGAGMDEKRLAEVRDGLIKKAPAETEIYGLFNVNERIKLDFGTEYGISVQSEQNQGTKIYVHLPFCCKKTDEIGENQ